MVKILNISEKPTFDLQDIVLTNFFEDDKFLLFKTKDIYQFNKVYGNITIRSRVMREDKQEFKYVENVISAVIDAGFNGYLCGKIKLTNAGVELCRNAKNLNDIVDFFKGCQQIYLFQSLAGNYYNGTSNQPDLEADIIFTL